MPVQLEQNKNPKSPQKFSNQSMDKKKEVIKSAETNDSLIGKK